MRHIKHLRKRGLLLHLIATKGQIVTKRLDCFKLIYKLVLEERESLAATRAQQAVTFVQAEAPEWCVAAKTLLKPAFRHACDTSNDYFPSDVSHCLGSLVLNIRPVAQALQEELAENWASKFRPRRQGRHL